MQEKQNVSSNTVSTTDPEEPSVMMQRLSAAGDGHR
jgi:hypothetical protein